MNTPFMAHSDAGPQQANGILTGISNAHTHLELTVPEPEPILPGETMGDWLMKMLDHHQDPVFSSPENRAKRIQAGINQLLACNTAYVNDVSSNGESLPLLDQAGIGGVVSIEFFCPGEIDPKNPPQYLIDRVEHYKMVADQYRNHPRLRVGLSPHAPYNVSPSAWRWMIEACDPPVIHTHVAESEDENHWHAGKPSVIGEVHQKLLGQSFSPALLNKSPVEYLHHFGLLDERVIIAHAVETNESDREILRKTKVKVAHCPRSNMFLQGKTLNLRDFEGIPLGLGTDGTVSCPNLSIVDEAASIPSLTEKDRDHYITTLSPFLQKTAE